MSKCEGCLVRRAYYGLYPEGKTSPAGSPFRPFTRWCMDCARKDHPNARRVNATKKCMGCGQASCDYERIRKRVWCWTCRSVEKPVLVRCLGCNVRQSLPIEKEKRWCAACVAAGRQVEASRLAKNLCAGCGLHQPKFGLPGQSDRGGKARWCSACAKNHSGAVDLRNKQCEECGLKGASFGDPTEKIKRWCSG